MTHPDERGSAAVRTVIRKYDLELESTSWYDAVNPRTGAKYEVKSTTGRGFRIWGKQHDSLTAAEGQNAAWYVFVHSGRMRRVRPTTVTQLVNAAGGWVTSGHHASQGKGERYLSVDDVF